jgi:hypothetical protein
VQLAAAGAGPLLEITQGAADEVATLSIERLQPLLPARGQRGERALAADAAIDGHPGGPEGRLERVDGGRPVLHARHHQLVPLPGSFQQGQGGRPGKLAHAITLEQRAQVVRADLVGLVLARRQQLQAAQRDGPRVARSALQHRQQPDQAIGGRVAQGEHREPPPIEPPEGAPPGQLPGGRQHRLRGSRAPEECRPLSGQRRELVLASDPAALHHRSGTHPIP